MSPSGGRLNPIVARAGQNQSAVEARLLLPSRADLEQSRLGAQEALRQTGTPRSTPIQVTVEGVIWDGHHAVRVAAERGETVEVRVVRLLVPPAAGLTILQLPVR